MCVCLCWPGGELFARRCSQVQALGGRAGSFGGWVVGVRSHPGALARQAGIPVRAIGKERRFGRAGADGGGAKGRELTLEGARRTSFGRRSSGRRAGCRWMRTMCSRAAVAAVGAAVVVGSRGLGSCR